MPQDPLEHIGGWMCQLAFILYCVSLSSVNSWIHNCLWLFRHTPKQHYLQSLVECILLSWHIIQLIKYMKLHSKSLMNPLSSQSARKRHAIFCELTFAKRNLFMLVGETEAN